MRSYQNLDAWKASMLLVKEVYYITKGFPKEETYGLTSQVKRALVSIPANIAEGVVRHHKKDTIQFLHIARGSVYELETLLKIAVMVGIIDESVFEKLLPKLDDVFRLLNGLINYMERTATI
ncbi:four helix bundle protein [Paracnuella aquatica]|uniref:four helix bundle protein n=1 Tax=Paracnuella aquatica TaxID=2268757 RepID=UPI000DEFB381|nr:four helix bundle protein [Paracnuella aquatica]RPD48803.1 four helix bundle protein [Paracnuella aquatica]